MSTIDGNKNLLANYVGPRGVFIFPKLNKPDDKFDVDGVYSVKIRFNPANPDAAKLVKGIEEMTAQLMDWGKAKLTARLETTKDAAKKGALKKKIAELALAASPLKPVFDEDGYETGEVEVNFKMKALKTKDGVKVAQRPKLVTAKRSPIDPKKTPIWGGSEGKVSGFLLSYYSDKDNVVGVSVKMQAVQVIELKQGSSGDDGFEDEDGYEGEYGYEGEPAYGDGFSEEAASGDFEGDARDF